MVKPGYKQTEIGVIPEDWDIKSLQDIVVSPLSYGVNAPAVPYDSNLYRYIRITDITEDGHYSKEDEVSVNILDGEKYCLCKGDILLARTGASTGKTYLYRTQDGKLVYAGFLIRASVDVDNYNPFYVFAQFHTKRYQDWVSTMSIRSGQPGINGKEYSSYLLPIPKIGEQKQIATTLSDIDALITNLEKLIAKKKAIKQGAMQELLTGKRRLPGFDGEWGNVVIGENGYLLRESINPQIMPLSVFSEYSMPAFDFGKKPNRVVGADMHSNRTVISGNVLLFNKLNVRQKRIWLVCASEKNAVCSSEFLPYCSDAISLRFLAHVLGTEEVTAYFIGSSTGTSNSQKRITPATFLEYSLFAPLEISEQNAIADVLDNMDREIVQLEQKLKKYQNIKCGMMSELLTGRIRLV